MELTPMSLRSLTTKGTLAVLLCLQLTTPATAELSCAPKGVPTTYPVESDPFFVQALGIWENVTKSRYIEGTPGKSCDTVTAIGYEGFPTWHCTYSSVDAGAGYYAPLKAEVVVLEPSAKELARWTVHACRVNSATDKTMGTCLNWLSSTVIGNNGAQFPIVGSVVESQCDWDGKAPICKYATVARKEPDNTWFRDGVSISYTKLAHWDNKTYNYAAILDTASSDKDMSAWYYYSRVSSAWRTDWTAWRLHIGKPALPDGVKSAGFDLAHQGWLEVSRAVHKQACSSDSNELMDAIVYTHQAKAFGYPKPVAKTKGAARSAKKTVG